ncbi:diphosphomevalonate decarboxylase [Candidatus Heimdallarchaeota archaeon B3_Heim]|nr:MAG: diphosphomevalonate decarboxylase [Candidatus Heimdallarchaeota archaeon B3_Heim]
MVMMLMKTTAIANSNIALVKYWGKRNSDLILPYNSSVSMTLNNLNTKTTVEFNKTLSEYEVTINRKVVKGEELARVANHLELLQKSSPHKIFAKVMSESNFPKKAGLASSASGFAALTLTGTKALGQDFTVKDLSILARRGSGSASRSILGGFVEWTKGSMSDGSDSYALQIEKEAHWPELSMIVTIISSEEKKVSSRAGMSQTVKNSPFYSAWLDTIESDVEKMKQAISEKDFIQLGKIAELNAIKMHATMQTTTPPIIYWEAGSLSIMKEVLKLREEGIECYFTMDAGPQVKILCQQKDIETIKSRVTEINLVKDIIICHPGKEARLTEDHLF